MLHSIAASYSTKPTEQDKADIINFLNSFASLFPCKNCGKHFKELLKENPVKNNSREELVMYMCDIHNIVNKKLGKKIFDCKKAFDFWGGNCGCGDQKEKTVKDEVNDGDKHVDKNEDKKNNSSVITNEHIDINNTTNNSSLKIDQN